MSKYVIGSILTDCNVAYYHLKNFLPKLEDVTLPINDSVQHLSDVWLTLLLLPVLSKSHFSGDFQLQV